jgi:hypothetical protein
MSGNAAPRQFKALGLNPITGINTNKVISEEAGLSYHGTLNLRVDIEVSAITLVGTATAKIQGRSPGGSYTDYAGANASVAITATGVFSIKQNVQVTADQANMPLHKNFRVVLSTTNAGDSVTIGAVYLSQG